MKMMFNCREMVDLISQELDMKLSFSVRLRMAMHLMMCRNCRTYRDQIQHVETMLNEHYKSTLYKEELALSPEAQSRIEEALQQ